VGKPLGSRGLPTSTNPGPYHRGIVAERSPPPSPYRPPPWPDERGRGDACALTLRCPYSSLTGDEADRSVHQLEGPGRAGSCRGEQSSLKEGADQSPADEERICEAPRGSSGAARRMRADPRSLVQAGGQQAGAVGQQVAAAGELTRTFPGLLRRISRGDPRDLSGDGSAASMRSDEGRPP
jgi:hypothetical protein